MRSSAAVVALEVRLWNTRPTRRSSPPLRSRASIVLAKSAGSGEPAIAAISAACSAMPRSKAGGKCSGPIRSKGGNPNGVSQASKNGLSVIRLPTTASAPPFRPEIGPAFFEEGGGALLRLLGVVIEGQRLKAERADAADIFAVGVERAFGDGDRGRRQRQDLLAPSLDLGIELVGRHYLVDQPHLERFGGGVAAAQEPDLARPLLADQARQIGGAPARIDRADARPDLAEHRLVRGDRQVAHGGQHVAAADRVALHLRDDRFAAVADRAVKFLDRQADAAAVAT